jgi:hypothetical protein
MPQNVNFAIRSGVAEILLSANDVPTYYSDSARILEPTELAEYAKEITVLVECK